MMRSQRWQYQERASGIHGAFVQFQASLCLLIAVNVNTQTCFSHTLSHLLHDKICGCPVRGFMSLKKNSNSFIFVYIWLHTTEHNLIFLFSPSPFQQNLPPKNKKQTIKAKQYFSSEVFLKHLCTVQGILGYRIHVPRPLESRFQKNTYTYFKIMCVYLCMYL